MTAFPEISRRVCDKYHNLKHDEMVKSIFNSRKNKAGVGMKILSWMITDEMKLIENYQMYAEAFRVDVPTTQSQPIESTQGTHRTTSAPRSPKPDVDEGESGAQQKSTIIRLYIPPRWSTRLTPPTPVPTIFEVEEMILQDTIQLSITEQKRTENVEEDVVDNSSLNSQNDPSTRLESESYKESLEVEIIYAEQPVNVIEKEEESAEDDYELRRRVKGNEIRFMPRKKFHVLAQHLHEAMEDSLPNMVDDCVKEVTKTQVPIYVAKGLTHPSEVTDDDELPVVQSCQRNPKAPVLSLANQDLFEKIVLSLHKFPAFIYPNDDIEERTSRWVEKYVKKFNPYARYSVLHCIESYQHKVNLTAPTITFPGIEKYKMFSIIFEPLYGIIYKNNKKEKRVMSHQEIYKFYDATLKRVLEGLKSYNNDVKHGYVTPSLSKEDGMKDPDMTMEEYVQYETKKSLRNSKVYNWETAKYGKIDYIGDIDYLRCFETKFPAIIYDGALSSQHVDEVNWNNETSLSEYCDENVISERKALKKQFYKK
ncbi:hypothetical protein Tco_0403219 [Tanacetum coccineum]